MLETIEEEGSTWFLHGLDPSQCRFYVSVSKNIYIPSVSDLEVVLDKVWIKH